VLPDGSVRNPVGNVGYAAPEVLTESPTAKVDVFSLGLVLVQLVLGCLPDAEGTYADLDPCSTLTVRNRLVRVGRALAKMAYARNIVALLRGCTQIDPADRLSARDALAVFRSDVTIDLPDSDQ
jgi:serine/threonine protein kinase